MNKVFKLIVLLFVTALIISCGSKRPPTGGPVDTDKPVVIASVPEAYGDISSGVIEITFSKALDKTTLTSAIYIYPPIANKKVSYESNTIKIRIAEKLQANTNYFVTLTTRLKDTRGNALAKNQTIVYRNGKLSEHRISGSINYELSEDASFPVSLNVLSADSLMIMSTQLSGKAFILEGLNPIGHILRAYVDKDNNGRYDFAREPYFEGRTSNDPIVNMDINLTYRDTILAQIRSVRAVSAREVEVLFTEEVTSYGELGIMSVKDNTPLPIRIKSHTKERLHLITADQDTSRYQIFIEKIRDPKGNETRRAGMQFNGSTREDTTAPKVVSTNPRNGTSVNDLRPIVTVTFSKIIPRENIKFELLSADRRERIPVDLLSGNARIYQFQPTIQLRNYRSYLLVISKETSDIFGNKLEQDFELSFLPLFRE